MSSRGGLLREVMLETSTTQSELSRVSGVHQPSISQFLSGKVELSDEQLDRLLSCMGYRLEVVRRPVVPELTRSERRSWRLHRQLSTHLTRTSLEQWLPTIHHNWERLRNGVSGEPHMRNLDRWRSLIDRGDVPRLRRVLTGLDRDSIEMRRFRRWAGCSRRTSVWTCSRWPADASRPAGTRHPDGLSDHRATGGDRGRLAGNPRKLRRGSNAAGDATAAPVIEVHRGARSRGCVHPGRCVLAHGVHPAQPRVRLAGAPMRAVGLPKQGGRRRASNGERPLTLSCGRQPSPDAGVDDQRRAPASSLAQPPPARHRRSGHRMFPLPADAAQMWIDSTTHAAQQVAAHSQVIRVRG